MPCLISSTGSQARTPAWAGGVGWGQGVKGPFGNRTRVGGSTKLKGMFKEQDLVCVNLTSNVLCPIGCHKEAIFFFFFNRLKFSNA